MLPLFSSNVLLFCSIAIFVIDCEQNSDNGGDASFGDSQVGSISTNHMQFHRRSPTATKKSILKQRGQIVEDEKWKESTTEYLPPVKTIPSAEGELIDPTLLERECNKKKDCKDYFCREGYCTEKCKEDERKEHCENECKQFCEDVDCLNKKKKKKNRVRICRKSIYATNRDHGITTAQPGNALDVLKNVAVKPFNKIKKAVQPEKALDVLKKVAVKPFKKFKKAAQPEPEPEHVDPSEPKVVRINKNVDVRKFPKELKQH